jgi:hypothetical protein
MISTVIYITPLTSFLPHDMHLALEVNNTNRAMQRSVARSIFNKLNHRTKDSTEVTGPRDYSSFYTENIILGIIHG